MEDAMTWKDKLELGLKDDAAFRKDNLPADEVRGREETSGPGRSPVVTEVRDDRTAAGEQAVMNQTQTPESSVRMRPQRRDGENET
jgi:hypothetical protein